ncbi:hypothetical protein [Streptomyces sp. NPDC102490]|uniref:hypothetical protein n=1 Tax=Streptomyces sp. NPDC102490 TaxID=3366183 RepID=UPI00380210F9
MPLAATRTGGNCNDVTQSVPTLEAVQPVRGKRRRPRCRSDAVLADRGRGYQHDKYRRLALDLGVKPVVAGRGTEHGSGFGTERRVVEPALSTCTAPSAADRREIRDDIHEAFSTLACALIWRRRLRQFSAATPRHQGRSAQPPEAT